MEIVEKIMLTIISWIALTAIVLALASGFDGNDMIIKVIIFVIFALILALFIVLGYAMCYIIWMMA